MRVSEYLDYKKCKCRKKLVNKLVEECNEIIEEVKIVREIRINAVLAYCTLCYFQYSLQLMLELLLILFTINM